MLGGLGTVADLTTVHWCAWGFRYRGFTELGGVWEEIGDARGRADIALHAKELLATAPLLLHALRTSLNRTVHTTPDGSRCWSHAAEEGCGGFRARAYPEMLYSGALADAQVWSTMMAGYHCTDRAYCGGVKNKTKPCPLAAQIC